MDRDTAIKLAAKFRSTDTIKMVREEVQRDGSVKVIRAELPIGRGWNSGQGALDWINMGWRSADEYDAAKHKEAVEAQQAEAAKAEAKPEKKGNK